MYDATHAAMNDASETIQSKQRYNSVENWIKGEKISKISKQNGE